MTIFNHKPVLISECITNLDMKQDGIYIDGTLGGAGHSCEIYSRLGPDGMLVGIDNDPYAIQYSAEKLRSTGNNSKLLLVNTNFKEMSDVCRQNAIQSVDGILLDLGVSSYQLDTASRGFSYQYDAPLDMRMNPDQELSAETVVNTYDEGRLRDIIRDYGEDKWAARIAQFIVKARSDSRIHSTYELVSIIKAAVPHAARREGPHPAKRTFQAIRIEVNNELGILAKAIDDAISLLKPQGRLCIITFHSLEDRIVKNTFAKHVNPCTCPSFFPQCICGKSPDGVHVTRKPIVPSESELDENPRSRSAKLRVIKKI